MNSVLNKIKKYFRKDNIPVLILAIAIAASAIIFSRIWANNFVEARLSRYDGLSFEGGFPMSEYDSSKYFQDEFNFRAYEDDNYTYKRGIDVSEFQGEIDWEKVKNAGVEFVMIRCGYRGADSGAIYEDDRFSENIKGATEQGIEVGLYFFSQAINADEAVEEAAYCCKLAKGKKITMPIAYDMEYAYGETDRIHGLTMAERTEIADAFCEVVENHGYDSLIYGNPTWIFSSYNVSLLEKRNFWLAHYGASTEFPYHYGMWQYNDHGIVDGINSTTDLNVYYVKKDK